MGNCPMNPLLAHVKLREPSAVSTTERRATESYGHAALSTLTCPSRRVE
jgi:hypothetical protein